MHIVEDDDKRRTLSRAVYAQNQFILHFIPKKYWEFINPLDNYEIIEKEHDGIQSSKISKDSIEIYEDREIRCSYRPEEVIVFNVNPDYFERVLEELNIDAYE